MGGHRELRQPPVHTHRAGEIAGPGAKAYLWREPAHQPRQARMDISDTDLLAKAVENEKLIAGTDDEREAAIREMVAGAELVFGLYPDRSDRGFNFTPIKGLEHINKADVVWDVIPFASANDLDDAYEKYGD